MEFDINSEPNFLTGDISPMYETPMPQFNKSASTGVTLFSSAKKLNFFNCDS